MFEKIKEVYKKYWFDRIYDPNWLKNKIDDRVVCSQCGDTFTTLLNREFIEILSGIDCLLCDNCKTELLYKL